MGEKNRVQTSGIFLFLTFFNNILILTWYGFYLHGIARLVAPAVVARQVASVAPLRLARQGCHAGGGGAAARQRAVDVGGSGATEATCHARWVGAARLLCRASLSRSLEWAAFQPTRRERTGLSRH